MRNLKAAKASKEEVDKAVQQLLSLKVPQLQLKELKVFGYMWK